jgi:hypothetical protein
VRRFAVKTYRPALRAILALGPYGGSSPARVTMRNTEASVTLSLPRRCQLIRVDLIWREKRDESGAAADGCCP